jgi:hypothetical protein
MYINAKTMIPVETAPGIKEGMGESSAGVNSSMMYLIHCKNLHKCYNVPPPSTTIILKFRKIKFFLKMCLLARHGITQLVIPAT